MRKIVLLFNALSYRPGMLKFARDIAGLSGSKLTALLVRDDTYLSTAPELRVVAGQAYVEEIVMNDDERESMKASIDATLTAFNTECEQYNLACDAHVETGNPVNIITKWSRFSDMLIVSPLLSFNADTHVPTAFITDLLPEVECPVLLCSEEYVPISEITLAYDGSKSSMYAIRHFFFLHPNYKSYKIKVLRINESGEETDTSNDSLFRDWMGIHCPAYSFVIMHGNASDVLLRYFLDNVSNDKMLVTGAFGRSAVSRFFRRSTADLVLKAADIPVFVAHA